MKKKILVLHIATYHQNATHLRNIFRQRTAAFEILIKQRLKTAVRYVTGCDPSINVGGDLIFSSLIHNSFVFILIQTSNNSTVPGNYIEITNFWQGYAVNEANLNTGNTCKKECTDYTFTKEYCNVNTTEKLSNNLKKHCIGNLRDCLEMPDENVQLSNLSMVRN